MNKATAALLALLLALSVANAPGLAEYRLMQSTFGCGFSSSSIPDTAQLFSGSGTPSLNKHAYGHGSRLALECEATTLTSSDESRRLLLLHVHKRFDSAFIAVASGRSPPHLL